MTQPRKEQIKNLKTRYTRFEGASGLVLSGGPEQEVFNVPLNLLYDNFLLSTRTGLVGGADSEVCASIYGSYGPFALSPGDSFVVTMQSLFVFIVEILPGDIISLGGSPFVTVSTLVDRINTKAVSEGLYSPVASNDNGRILLRSVDESGVTYGSAASITLSEITPNILSVLGFVQTPSSSVSVLGSSPSVRGIITETNDGGGRIELRTTAGAEVHPSTGEMYNIGGRSVSRWARGLPCFARVRQVPGPHINGQRLVFTYNRLATRSEKVVTKKVDPTSLLGETVQIDLDYGDGNGLLSFEVLFGAATTVDDVVDSFNASLVSAMNVSRGFYPDAAVFIPVQTFKLHSGDSFFIRLNDNAPVHVSIASDVSDASSLVSIINAAIFAMGQTSEGGAKVENGFLKIYSELTNPLTAADFTQFESATVEIIPGNPGGLVPGTYMKTLEKLCILPGIYKFGAIARKFGTTEIELSNPSSHPTASLVITKVSTNSFTRLGLPGTSVSLGVSTFEERVVVPEVVALIPESLEFSEEPDDGRIQESTFFEGGQKPSFDSVGGAREIPSFPNLGLDGFLSAPGVPSLIRTALVETLKFQGDKLGSFDQYLVPEMSSSNDANSGPVLIHEIREHQSGTKYPLRIYASGRRFAVSVNARVSSADISNYGWAQDDTSVPSCLFELRNGALSVGSMPSGSSTWVDSAWKRNTFDSRLYSTSGVVPTKFSTTAIADSFMGLMHVSSPGAMSIGTYIAPRSTYGANDIDHSNLQLTFNADYDPTAVEYNPTNSLLPSYVWYINQNSISVRKASLAGVFAPDETGPELLGIPSGISTPKKTGSCSLYTYAGSPITLTSIDDHRIIMDGVNGAVSTLVITAPSVLLDSNSETRTLRVSIRRTSLSLMNAVSFVSTDGFVVLSSPEDLLLSPITGGGTYWWDLYTLEFIHHEVFVSVRRFRS